MDYWTAFIDECPSLSDENIFFCVALVAHNKNIYKKIEKLFKKLRRNLGKKKGQITEFKFHNSDSKTRSYIAQSIQKLNLEIFGLIIDKNKRKIADTPENYGLIIRELLAMTNKKKHSLSVILDKRYTNTNQYESFKEVLFTGLKNSYVVESVDSQTNSGLQLADFVVGIFNQKYNQLNTDLWKQISSKIVKEVIKEWKEIKAKAIRP